MLNPPYYGNSLRVVVTLHFNSVYSIHHDVHYSQLNNYITINQENFDIEHFCLSYTTIVVYSRDHKGVGVAQEITSPKNSLAFPR